MNELLAVALICAATVSQQDCSRETALDIIVSPAASNMECIMYGQASVAHAELLGEGRYLKVACERRYKAVAAPLEQAQ